MVRDLVSESPSGQRPAPGACAAELCRYGIERRRTPGARRLARAPQNFVDMGSSDAARRRQEGLVYLIEREFALPFGEWVRQVQNARNQYASTHKLPKKEIQFDWQDTSTLHSQAINREL